MHYIVCVHGKKRSGKDTLADNLMAATNSEKKGMKISFATPLKRMAIDLFGFSEKQCYGDNNDRNTEGKVYWSDMINLLMVSHIYVSRNSFKPFDTNTIIEFLFNANIIRRGERNKFIRNVNNQIMPDNPYDWKMTAREFLQFFGTDIIRRLYDDAWINYTCNEIRNILSNSSIKTNIYIPDTRFKNELLGLKNLAQEYTKFKVYPIFIKLRRGFSENQKDLHPSEAGLDDSYFDLVIDNGSIEETANTAINFLSSIGAL